MKLVLELKRRTKLHIFFLVSLNDVANEFCMEGQNIDNSLGGGGGGLRNLKIRRVLIFIYYFVY